MTKVTITFDVDEKGAQWASTRTYQFARSAIQKAVDDSGNGATNVRVSNLTIVVAESDEVKPAKPTAANDV
jgi:hypothetical protein